MITYETAKQMKELGLPQKRHKSAKYYVTPDIIIDFEAIHDLKDAKAWNDKRFEEQVNWQDYFTYIPELIDLIPLENYNLTLDAAAWQFIEGRKSQQGDLIKRTEGVAPSGPEEKPLRDGKATLGVTEYDKTVHIADATYEGIEKIKEAIQKNANKL